MESEGSGHKYERATEMSKTPEIVRMTLDTTNMLSEEFGPYCVFHKGEYQDQLILHGQYESLKGAIDGMNEISHTGEKCILKIVSVEITEM